MSQPTWQQCAQALSDFLAKGDATRLNCEDRDVSTALIVTSLIERIEQSKPCACCGKPKHDFTYWKVTPAGRMLVAALSSTTQDGEAA